MDNKLLSTVFIAMMLVSSALMPQKVFAVMTAHPDESFSLLLKQSSAWVVAAQADEPAFLWVKPQPISQKQRLSEPRQLAAAGKITGLGRLNDYERKGHLSLSAHLPTTLQVSDEAIEWQITPMMDKGQQRHYRRFGRWLDMSLPAGEYQVRLQIGHFQRLRQIMVVQRQTERVPFYVNAGRLQLNANEAVNWHIRSASGAMIRIDHVPHVDLVVEAGMYTVDAVMKDTRYRENMRVDQGQTFTARMKIPVGHVNLIAVKNNAPLFQPMQWRIFRLDRGDKKEVAYYDRHARGIVMPPGRYEAVATVGNTTRSREFWVKNGTHNEVILAMD